MLWLEVGHIPTKGRVCAGWFSSPPPLSPLNPSQWGHTPPAYKAYLFDGFACPQWLPGSRRIIGLYTSCRPISPFAHLAQICFVTLAILARILFSPFFYQTTRKACKIHSPLLFKNVLHFFPSFIETVQEKPPSKIPPPGMPFVAVEC